MSQNEKKVCMIAHRGYSSRFQPNTERAFIEAARHGSGGAETDIRFTRDGVYVTNHDPDVRYADGTRLMIADHSFAELTEKPLLNEHSEEELYLCTYKRYLEIMRDNGMICFVELKGSYTEEQVKEVFDIAEAVYDLKKVIFQSFDFNNLLQARRLFAELPIMYTYGSCETHYERCFEHGFSIDCDQYIITREMIDEFHAHGLEVALWTVNDRERLDYCLSLGVEYIESDVFGGEDVK